MQITATLTEADFTTPDVTFPNRQVQVTDGIAKVAPSCLDFCDSYGINRDDWYGLHRAVECVDAVLGSLDECNPPDLRARWTLYRSLQRINAASEILEKHIASKGLWLSEDELWKCEGCEMQTLQPEDFQDGIRKAG